MSRRREAFELVILALLAGVALAWSVLLLSQAVRQHRRSRRPFDQTAREVEIAARALATLQRHGAAASQTLAADLAALRHAAAVLRGEREWFKGGKRA